MRMSYHILIIFFILLQVNFYGGNEIKTSKETLKGFVVTDAHFGWVNHQVDGKEHPEWSHQAMLQIMKRFPDLNMFVDVGDAFHAQNTAEEDYRLKEWTSFIANSAGTTPFFFSVGNHEQCLEPKLDYEARINTLGSIPCRPYYSFDIKGIHFIAFPELMTAATISKESIEWLKLDLALNQDKTTIIFSHNSIKGTTLPQDDMGYRRVVNSDELFDLLLNYPNIVAWIHGHNHTFEMVKLEDIGKIFISAGRIGGFDPRYPWEDRTKQGMGHMGGIYFEINSEHLIFKSYSATSDKFFEEILGHQHLSQTMEVKTSFDPDALSCFSYGSGNTLDKQRIVVFNHNVLESGTQELYIAGGEGNIINENSDLMDWYQRTLPDCQSKHLSGYIIEPAFSNAQYADETWQWVTPNGVKIRPYGHIGKDRRIEIPGKRESQRCYYRCAPGTKYNISTKIEATKPNQKMFMKFFVFNNQLQELANFKSPEWTLDIGTKTYNYEFQIPASFPDESIYSNSNSDTFLQMMFEIDFPALNQEVIVRNIEIRFADATEKTLNPQIIFDGNPLPNPPPINGGGKGGGDVQRQLDAGNFVKFALEEKPKARTVVECHTEGNHRLTWLVRQVGVKWQVRNATVTDKGNYFEIGPMINPYSPNKEIVIAPMCQIQGAYAHCLRYINQAKIHPGNGKNVKVDIIEIEEGKIAEVELITPNKPKKVKGGSFEYSDGRTIVKRENLGTIVVEM